jgi:hypothetical protein
MLTRRQPRYFSKEHEYGITLTVVFYSESGSTFVEGGYCITVQGCKIGSDGDFIRYGKIGYKT